MADWKDHQWHFTDQEIHLCVFSPLSFRLFRTFFPHITQFAWCLFCVFCSRLVLFDFISPRLQLFLFPIFEISMCVCCNKFRDPQLNQQFFWYKAPLAESNPNDVWIDSTDHMIHPLAASPAGRTLLHITPRLSALYKPLLPCSQR